MTSIKRKKCRHCRRLFVPDARNKGRQRYCSQTACQKASKNASQKRWLAKPENKNYFRGPENVQRVQQWREQHPVLYKNSYGAKTRQNEGLIRKSEKNLIHLQGELDGIGRARGIFRALGQFLAGQKADFDGLLLHR